MKVWIRLTSVFLAVFLVGLHFSLGVAKAKMVGTEEALRPAASVEQNRDRVRAFLDREDVRAQMVSLGVSPEEAKARVASLSDEEINRISGHLDKLPAGEGDAGLIVGIILIILLVLLIVDKTGPTDDPAFLSSLRTRNSNGCCTPG